jgi:hypothetical protein
MTETIAGIVLIVGMILGFIVARKYGLLSPASVYIWFMIIDLVIFLIIAYGHLNKADFTWTAMPWPPFDGVILPVTLIYAILMPLGWISVLGLHKPEAPSQVLEGMLKSLPRLRKNFTFLVAAFLLLVLWIEIVDFWEIDKGLFWRNNVYLLLNDPGSVGIHSLVGRMSHYLQRPIGLLLVSAGAFFWVRGRRLTGGLFFLASIYPLLMAVAENSRWAPLLVLGGVAVMAFFGNIRRHLPAMAAGSLFGLVLFVKVLIGRNTPYQGLGGTFDVFRVILADLQLQRWGIGFFLNIFEGAQSLANSLLMHPTFPINYAVLSFSPTISAIDHFDRIMPSAVRLITPIVPMNVYSEAWFFGPPYFLFLVIVVLVWLRLMTKLFLRKDAIGIAFSIYSYGLIFFMSQYAVRNTMRWLYFSLLIGILVDTALSAKPRTQAEEPAAPPTPGEEGTAAT